MTSLVVSIGLALAIGSTGQYPGQQVSFPQGRWVMPPGPGYGWGFPNGNPDGYGFWDPGCLHPLGANRTSDYFFRRYYGVPVDQMFMPNYYNPYVTRGQRYLPFAGCGGWHPVGVPPLGSAETPVHPYDNSLGNGASVSIPSFSGRVEAPPINSGGTGLTP